MKQIYLVFLAIFFANSAAYAEPSTPEAEVEQLKKNTVCKDFKYMPPSGGMGSLYSCVLGTAETVKLFVNGTTDNKIDNIKLMWNEWTHDIGYGLAADKQVAFAMLDKMATLYAGNQKEAVINAFKGTSEKLFEIDDYTITYNHIVGPKINEHLLIIDPKGN